VNRLELLHEAKLADGCTAEARHAVRAVRPVAGSGMDGERTLILLMDEEESLPATSGTRIRG
jgi:hypothetical protein